ncbi:DCC1-like thiol-disulfide oxidoreductase family protein [Halomonas vilamensis]|uniref:DCC1-like thiol-disulfide oxidoreductase family protein n=1 Tax=Vreelandella vilamensis TaxID=531309 RepID=A0ABU1H6Z2_9GAMM|nr:DCC1-like thiol-disulfide oxidoreductase family protein [Halomonas vilamensis]MDR5900061.1 DCC1-like thiol-disulfide oxidoreductase family protein [Halomonas vilamensis]
MKNLPPYMGEHDQVVLFDSVCKLCNGWAKFLIRHDPQRAFRLASVQSPQGQALLQWFGLPTDEYETLVLIRQGRPCLCSVRGHHSHLLESGPAMETRRGCLADPETSS